jgi:hypothetical protein
MSFRERVRLSKARDRGMSGAMVDIAPHWVYVGIKEQVVGETWSRHEERDDRKRGRRRCATSSSFSVYSFSIQNGQGATRGQGGAQSGLMTSEAGKP